MVGWPGSRIQTLIGEVFHASSAAPDLEPN